jgi:DNA-damage-inducible protein D
VTGPRIPTTHGPSGTFAALDRHPAPSSPFDAIRRLTAEGREYWSARELMPLLGYDQWRRFADAVSRARISGHNAGHDMTLHIAGAGKLAGSRPQGGGNTAENFHLSRLACYLIAMNGDPRKPEVAAAQTYFAVRTREAETSPAAAPALTEDEIVHQALAITARRVEQLTALVAELEPKAEFYDDLMDADGTYSMLAVSKMLGWGRNIMMRELRRAGVLQGNNLPYQRYEHHFKVTPVTYVNRKTGETVPTATTTVLAVRDRVHPEAPRPLGGTRGDRPVTAAAALLLTYLGWLICRLGEEGRRLDELIWSLEFDDQTPALLARFDSCDPPHLIGDLEAPPIGPNPFRN